MANENQGPESLSNIISNLSLTIFALKSSIDQYANENLRQKAISVNTSLVEQINKNSAILEDVPGRIAGNLEQAINAQIAGIQGYDKNMALLSSEMRFTNQNWSGMLTGLEANRAGLQLSNESRNKLAKHTLNVADTYKIQTGILVDTIQNLTGFLSEFTGAKFSGPLQTAVTQLQGMLGPQYAKDLNKFVTSLLEPSIDGMVEASKLGLNGIRQQIYQSQDSDQILNNLIKAMKIGGDKWDGIIRAGEKSGGLDVKIGVFTSIFDEHMTNTASILSAGLEQGKKKLTLDELYHNTVGKLKDSVEVLATSVMSDLLVSVADTGSLLLRILGWGNGAIGKIVFLTTTLTFLGSKAVALDLAIKANTKAIHGSILSNKILGGKFNMMGMFARRLVSFGAGLLRFAGWIGILISLIELISSSLTGKGLLGHLFDDGLKVDKVEVNSLETKKEAADYTDLFGGTADLLKSIMRDIVTDTNDVLIEETRLAREQSAEYANRQLAALDKLGTRVIPE